jgi:hypothetical protein
LLLHLRSPPLQHSEMAGGCIQAGC